MSTEKRIWDFRKGQRGLVISYLQEKLKELGFEPGAPDGIFDSRLGEAILEFQRKNDIEPTGLLDRDTIKRLYELTEGPDYPEGLVEALSAEPKGTSALAARPAPARDSKAIVISPSERALGLFEGGRLIRKYPAAVGKPETPTPLGTFRVLEKVVNPGGVLGTRWMAFTYEMHGIHGTNRPELIGQAVSNGCVRMYNENVEELYEMVEVGTPVVVTSLPVEEWSGADGAIPGKAPTPEGPKPPASQRPEPKDSNRKPDAGASEPGTGLTGKPHRTYTVRPGDSLWKIAQQFGTTIDALVHLNGIKDPDVIYPGQVLRIPD